MNIYPLNSTQEDMLRESNMETMENGFLVTVKYELPEKIMTADEVAASCQKVFDTNHYTHANSIYLDIQRMGGSQK